MKSLEKQLSELLNSVSRENDSNTPDFILAEYMMNCLNAFELANNKREVWYKVELKPGHGRRKRKIINRKSSKGEAKCVEN